MAAPGQAMVAADPRPPLGMTLLRDLRPDGDGALGGQLYNRENAKTYSVRLTLDGADQLLVRGYIGLPIFGQTQLWRRVPAGGGQP
ncbi:MAG: hypothetical protein CFE45_16045 [Burkholderiales bacterium PBB5]|nr:MAG: hypothetical protein CFE45_16045 [Burkholderiales bacterium PBB5]